MMTADQVVEQDLAYICSELEREFSKMSGTNLLIIGGAGFLGYYLVQSIVAWNKLNSPSGQITLTVYDNYIRGVPLWLNALSDKVSIVKHDITDPLPSDIADFDYIVHAASIASPTYYRRYPIETMDANVNGLRIILDYCVAQKESGRPVKGLLFYSTSEIYGDPDPTSIPTPETYRGNVSCTGPRACYDESKRFGETLCVNFAQHHGVAVKIARPFNNYGPGLKISDRRVLPDFARDILAEQDIVMLSDGTPTRTFCYIADAVCGYYKVLLNGKSGESYNIGVETPEISMLELANLMVKKAQTHLGYKGRVVERASEDSDYLIDNPQRRCPDITKARTQLGYTPKIELEEGMSRTLIWYKANPDAEDK